MSDATIEDLGKGIHLIGVPKSQMEFVDLCVQYGCPYYKAQEIYAELQVCGERKITVTSSLPYDLLLEHLREQGLEVKQIPSMFQTIQG